MLVLANSYKSHPGRCIAGREVVQGSRGVGLGRWIRPVSGEGDGMNGALIPGRHCRVDDGQSIRPLDVMQIPLAENGGSASQPENCRVRPEETWRRLGRLDRTDGLSSVVETPESLWGHGDGRCDRIVATASVNSSLMLIRPESFQVQLERSNFKRSPKIRALIGYHGHSYKFSITDDAFIRRVVPSPPNQTEVIDVPEGAGCVLCLSLGVPFHGFRYKLVAGVMPLH